MESQKRMKIIMGHFAGTEDASATQVFPLNCSNVINYVVRRCDNRTIFARQGSTSQAFFMRQQQDKYSFEPAQPPNSSGSGIQNSSCTRKPVFSRPVPAKPDLPNVVERKPMKQECILSMAEPPMFARPNRGFNAQNKFFSKKIEHTSRSNGMEWSPRMDIAESGSNFIVTLELPGVNSDDMRVEINDQSLVMTGKRSTSLLQMASGSKGLSPKYHKKEISEGSYKVVWPLPSEVKKEKVSAEFVNGFLQITLPRL